MSTASSSAAQAEIMILEDQMEERKSLVWILGEFVSPSRIAAFAHTREAEGFLLEMETSMDPDLVAPLRLVILDLHVDGDESLPFLRRFKRGERTCQIPVVIFSDSKDERDVARGYSYGANAFVTKPVGFEAFDEAVQAIAYFWLEINRAGRTRIRARQKRRMNL